MSKDKSKEKSKDKVKDKEYKVGDKIIVKGRPGKRGQIIWIGEPKGWNGKYYGVRLTEKRGDCDGEYKGQRFFSCEKGYGVYIQKKLIVDFLDDDEGKDFDFMGETDEIKKEKEENDKKYTAEKDKLQSLKKAFKDTDTDGSLELDIKEFRKLAIKSLNCKESDADNLFKSIDITKNGKISFAEFDAWLGNGGITKLEQYGKLTQAFKDADKDGNLTLNKEEFQKMAKDSMELDEKDADDLFAKIDLNENGDISFTEWEAYVDDIGGMDNLKQFRNLKQYFKDADKDGNNSLDLEEFVKLSKEKLGIPSYKAKRLFTKVDKDNSGSISFEEFDKYVETIGGVRVIEKKEEEVKEEAEQAKKEEAEKAEMAKKEEEAAKKEEEAPKEEAPKDEENKEAEEAPKEEAEAPKEDAEAPKEEPPKEEPPKEEENKEEAKEDTKPAKKDGKKAPAKKDAKKDAKKVGKKAPAKKDAKKTPAKKGAAKKTPAKKDAKKTPAKKSPAKKTPAKKTPAKKDAKKTPAKKGAAAKKPTSSKKKDAAKKKPAAKKKGK